MSLGKIVTAKVVAIQKSYLEVECQNKARGIVHISQVSDYYISSLSKMFKIGQNYEFLVISNKRNPKFELSWKQIHPRFMKNPFEFTISESKGKFENLIKNTYKELQND